MSSRRTLLKTGLIAGSVSALGIGTGMYLHRQAEDRRLARHLAQLLDNTERAGMLGRALLSESGAFASASAAQLNDDLLQRLELDREAVATIEVPLLLERMHVLVEEDFREENIVIVNGWLLSQTEARLCALSSLSADT